MAIVAATAMAAPAFQDTPKSNQAFASLHPVYFGIFLCCAVAYLIGSWGTLNRDIKKRKYDTSIALKYTDVFFKDLAKERKSGNKILIKFLRGTTDWKDFKEAPEIEPILDVLDDVGFLLQGDQISDWVVYQYFSHWIQMYYEAARGYIELKRRENVAYWEHIPDMYEDMMDIDAHKNSKRKEQLIRTQEELIQLLEEENEMY